MNRTNSSLASLHQPPAKLQAEAGVVLVAVLWIFAALSIIALSFSKESRVEVSAARNAQSLESAYFAARAGMVATIYRIKQKKALAQTAVQSGIQQQEFDDIDLGTAKGKFGGIQYEVDVQDESGKIGVRQLNQSTEGNQQKEQLMALMQAIGISSKDADNITDSMIDWTDGDNLARLNGAENDYYQSLNPSYNAKNGPIDVVEELLLVKGMTPDYFYGYPERDAGGSIIYKYGLYKYLTTYSGSNFMVNANAAPIPVLLSISGMTQEMAKAIYERRRTQPFKDKQELANFASNLDINALNRLSVLSPIQSNIYCLTASAHAENSKIRRIVRAVVSLDSFGNDAGYRILYWNENVPDYEGANQ